MCILYRPSRRAFQALIRTRIRSGETPRLRGAMPVLKSGCHPPDNLRSGERRMTLGAGATVARSFAFVERSFEVNQIRAGQPRAGCRFTGSAATTF